MPVWELALIASGDLKTCTVQRTNVSKYGRSVHCVGVRHVLPKSQVSPNNNLRFGRCRHGWIASRRATDLANARKYADDESAAGSFPEYQRVDAWIYVATVKVPAAVS